MPPPIHQQRETEEQTTLSPQTTTKGKRGKYRLTELVKFISSVRQGGMEDISMPVGRLKSPEEGCWVNMEEKHVVVKRRVNNTGDICTVLVPFSNVSTVEFNDADTPDEIKCLTRASRTKE